MEMEFSEDFVAIQSVLNSLYNSTGDFLIIRHVGGNENKISNVVEDFEYLFTRKKYIRERKVNQKHEMKIRKMILFLILNTELSNKSLITNNKVAHLIGIVPQLSKCLLTNIIFKLGLHQYYGEAICSCPLQISLELLQHCSKCIKTADPYAMLEQISTIASAIYYKVYHVRYEINTKLDTNLAKLVEKFNDILKCYIAPVTDQMVEWEVDKMYQYMGQAILDMLNLLKNCLYVYNMNEFVAPYYQFYQWSQETTHSLIDSPNTLNKSNEMLKECNKHLILQCESNVVAVTLDVFCSWTECIVNDSNLQETVAYVAYEVLELIKNMEDVEDFSKILHSIARKPQTIQDKINNASSETILENVVIKNKYQNLWYKAFLRSGIFRTNEIYNIFQSLIHLSDNEDYAFLLRLNTEIKNEYDLKEFLIKNLLNIPPDDSIKIISQYFIEEGINNVYELDNFNMNNRELLNKLKCDESSNISYKEISILVLQNPIKFINNILEESDKNINHLTNILHILNYINSICNIKCNDKEHTVLHEMILNKLKHSHFEPSAEICVIKLINHLIECQLLTNIIYDQLQDIIEVSIRNSQFKRAIFICQLCQTLPISTMPCDNYIPVIFKLGTLMSELRWTFFNYSEEKVTLISGIITLIYHYKTNIQDELLDENSKNEHEILKTRIDAFHIFRKIKYESNHFLPYVSEGYDVNSIHPEQVTRLINLLPRCVPLEWELVAKYLISNKNSVSLVQLFTDVMLVLSEMSKKSAINQDSLSYCFQQFCVVIKDIIFSTNEKSIDMEKLFIKNICRLIKHLPDSLQNTFEVSLVNLFNFEVLKSLKDDEDFLYSLVSISHLNICKIICSKMA